MHSFMYTNTQYLPPEPPRAVDYYDAYTCPDDWVYQYFNTTTIELKNMAVTLVVPKNVNPLFSGQFNANNHHLLLSSEYIFHSTTTPVPEGSIKYQESVTTSYIYMDGVGSG